VGNIKFRALYPESKVAILEDGSLVSYTIHQADTGVMGEMDVTLIDANVTDQRTKTKAPPFAHPARLEP
jgi:hypothetical protein